MKCHRGISFMRIFKCLLAFQLFYAARFIRGQLVMVTEGRVQVVNQGSSVVFPCEFVEEKYNFFQQPVLWRKRQLREEVQMNVAGSLNEPFASLSRFEVSYQSSPPKYKFQLVIRDLCVLDDGNYTCEVRGEFSQVLGRTTHQLYVRAPVSSVIISAAEGILQTDSNANSEAPTKRQTTSTAHSSQRSRFFRLVAERPHAMKCVVIGGYPPPHVDIFIGNRSISRDFHLHARSSIVSGKRGLRLMTHQIEATTDSLRVQPRDHLQPLICVATGPGPKPVYDEVLLRVEYPPSINCSHAFARPNEPKVLACIVASKPRPDFYAWVVDSQGTFISHPTLEAKNSTVNELNLPLFFSLHSPLSKENTMYSMTVTPLQEDRHEVRLIIGHVTSSSFGRFPLIVRNSIATTTSYAHLTVEERRQNKLKVPRQHVTSKDRNPASHATRAFPLVPIISMHIIITTYDAFEARIES